MTEPEPYIRHLNAMYECFEMVLNDGAAMVSLSLTSDGELTLRVIPREDVRITTKVALNEIDF